MTIEDTIRQTVREEMRSMTAELRALLEQARPSSGGDSYLSVEKAATLADVHPDTIRGWVKAGRLPEHRAGRELRVRRDELHRFLDGRASDIARPTPEEEAGGILSRRQR